MRRVEVAPVLLSLVSAGGFRYDPTAFTDIVHEAHGRLQDSHRRALLDKATELELEALENDDEEAGEAISNMGGFHSTQNLFDDDQCETCASLAILRDAVHAAVEAADPDAVLDASRPPEAWVNVNRTGDYNLMHDHEGASWSGVYYADAGPTEAKQTSGALILTRRLEEEEEDTVCYCGVVPTTGMICLFPGWLPHAVLPFEPGEGAANATRVSFSFNLFTTQRRGRKREHAAGHADA